jgi:hypothetical protein
MDENSLILSSLGHTWILDLDGSVLKHNGYKIDGEDTFLPKSKEFLMSIPENDMVIFLTSRNSEYKEMTENFLIENDIRYDHIIYDVPYGERILVNDRKTSGLRMSVGVNLERDKFDMPKVIIDEEL